MDPVTLAILLGGGALAKGIGSRMAQNEQEKVDAANEEAKKKEALKEAMQRAMGEKVVPFRYRKDQEADTTNADILSGLGSVAGMVPSMFGGA